MWFSDLTFRYPTPATLHAGQLFYSRALCLWYCLCLEISCPEYPQDSLVCFFQIFAAISHWLFSWQYLKLQPTLSPRSTLSLFSVLLFSKSYNHVTYYKVWSCYYYCCSLFLWLILRFPKILTCSQVGKGPGTGFRIIQTWVPVLPHSSAIPWPGPVP